MIEPDENFSVNSYADASDAGATFAQFKKGKYL